MNMKAHTLKKMIAGASCGLVMMAGTAIAQDAGLVNTQAPYQIAQGIGTTPDGTLGAGGNVDATNSNTTPTNGAADNAPTTTTTQVEVNTPPAQQSMPDVNVQMPDINVPAVGGTDRETVTTERSEKIIMTDTDNNDADTGFSMMYLALFGVLAIFLIAVIAIAASRREDVAPPRA